MRKNPSVMAMLCYPPLRETTMIRLYIELKEPVRPDALRRAVALAMERYPYFTVELVPKQGDFLPELVYNPRPVLVREGHDAPTLGSEETNRHLLAFGYEEKTVIVDFSHGLADGAGLMEMVKTLLYYYVHEAAGQWLPADGIRTLETPITPEETTDPYWDLPPLESRFSPARPSAPDAFILAEDGLSGGPAVLRRFRVGEDTFLRYSRDNDGSPATMFAVFIAKAIFRLHPDLTRDVNIMLARNLRPGFGTPQAHHSLADSFLLCYPAKCRDWSVERLGGVSRGMVYLNTDRDALLTCIHNKRAFLDRLYTAKSQQEIDGMMGGSFRAASRRCAAVSYVGRCIPRQMDTVVENLYTVVGAMGSALVTEINAVNGRFCCTLMQGFSEDTYIRAIAEELRREGIEMELDEPEPLILAKLEM